MPEVELTGRAAPLYRWLDWPLRLALVTVLWCLGVAAGLVLTGVAPATIAAHRVLTSYREDVEPRPWTVFWSGWRSWLGRGQLALGLPLATVWVLAFYLVAVRQTVWAVPLSVILVGYLVTLWLLPPVLLNAGSRRTTESWLLTVHLTWRRPALPLAVFAALVVAAVGAWYVVPAALVFGPATAALAAVLVSSRRLTRDSPDPTRSGPPAR
ncbi:YesL family protein [Kribbella lupini]|uniref:Membrane protein YesL n=1 Tax=Kribbella lupini TaxID=291602 RepID=A0ABP4MXC9_9ACTN